MAAISSDNHGLRLVTRYVVLTLIALIFIFPLVFMVVSSFKPDLQLLRDASSIRAFLPVGDISTNNYTAAFERAPIGLFVFNSVLVTGVTVLFSLLICSLAAFSFVFLEWKGRNVLLSIIIATLIIPFETIAIPLLLLVSKLPWIGFEPAKRNGFRFNPPDFNDHGPLCRWCCVFSCYYGFHLYGERQLLHVCYWP